MSDCEIATLLLNLPLPPDHRTVGGWWFYRVPYRAWRQLDVSREDHTDPGRDVVSVRRLPTHPLRTEAVRAWGYCTGVGVFCNVHLDGRVAWSSPRSEAGVPADVEALMRSCLLAIRRDEVLWCPD